MAELKKLENNFSKDFKAIFEDIATLLFCTELGLSHGVNRPVNFIGIESDPITIGSATYGYQAKYYDASTKLRSRKNDFISCIQEARKKGVTNLMFFVNKNFTENSKTGKKPDYILEIEKEAIGIKSESKIHVDWWTLSKIESSLDMPKFAHIRKRFFTDGDNASIISFYEEVVNAIEDCPEKDSVYGDISLKEGYIEPHILIGNNLITAKEYLESWIVGNRGEHRILLIHGEPGHGKTSMCLKAVYDYYKQGWLFGVVSNVFTFSLNPVNTSILDSKTLSLKSLLSWGFERENKLSIQDCKDALIFFDAYDELIECVDTIDYLAFIERIKDFQKRTNTFIVITSRSMAISLYINQNLIPTQEVATYELQPISKAGQLDWLMKYSKHGIISNKRQKYDWDEYVRLFQNRFTKAHYKRLLGIPIILRMIVVSQYLPEDTANITKIYDDLFDNTWYRHAHSANGTTMTKESVFRALQKHALAMFIDNTETAKTNTLLESPWIFSFYTKEKKYVENGLNYIRVGFLHRSFYQYFLANEILSWYKDYSFKKEAGINEFNNNLSYLARRKVDPTTLSYLRELFMRKHSGTAYEASFDYAQKIIYESDGFLPLPHRKEDAELITKNSIPLERANNIFWNIVTIGSTCNYVVTNNKIHVKGIQFYDFDECNLKNAQLSNANFNRAHLFRANLIGADLSGSDLSFADLRGANLNLSDLNRTNLKGASLRGANLRGASLHRADLRDADLHETDLSDADLYGSILNGLDLRKTILKRAKLGRVNMGEVNLHGIDLHGVDLHNANLRRANLSGANLCNADLRKANLLGTDFSGADLSGADLSDADLSGANLSGADLSGANLNRTTIRDADFRDSKLFWIIINQTNAIYLIAHGHNNPYMHIIDDMPSY